MSTVLVKQENCDPNYRLFFKGYDGIRFNELFDTQDLRPKKHRGVVELTLKTIKKEVCKKIL